MSFDLFISYSRKDNQEGRITQLVERICTDFQAFAGRSLNPFFDKDEIQGMDDWRHRILKGVRESHLLLSCLSPTYLQSEYCEWEFNEYLKTEIGRAYFGDSIAPVYFIEVPGWEDKEFARQCATWVAELRRRQHFDLRPWFHAGEEALREVSVMGQMERLSQQIKERIQRGERAEASLGNVENHNPHFMGRAVELRRLRETLALGRVGVLTAVHGLGGVGKTALATEYAHAYAHEYGGGRWQVRCEGKDNLRAAITSLHGETGFAFEFTEPEKLDVALQYKRVLNELKELADSHEPHRCLLLLDNVDQPKLLEPAQTKNLPSAEWLHVLATTRLGEKELFGTHKDRAFLPVDELPEANALNLIESYQPGETFSNDSERTAALEIVRLLGCFTLAVESAAVYLGKFASEGVTCSGFLARLKKDGLDGLDKAADESEEGVRHGEIRLGSTLLPTLERLGEAEKLALSYAALLPADQVALPWLRALVSEQFPDIGKDAEPGYPDPWKNLLRRLLSLRLLQKTDAISVGGEVLVTRVHRLVRELIRGQMTTEDRDAQQVSIVQLIQTRDAILKKTTQWEQARWELDPLDALAILWAETNHPHAAWLLSQVGISWKYLAEWQRGETLMRLALAIDEQNPSPHLNNLAMLLQDTGRFPEAESLIRQAKSIAERKMGSDHPDFATCLNNLATILLHTNRLTEAETLIRKALAIDEQNLGKEHPDVARDLHNLARLLEHIDQHAEAELLLRRALDIYALSSRSDHSKVATCLQSLAALLRKTNRIAEAEPLIRRALAINEQFFGKDHPHVANCLDTLAYLLKDIGRFSEAEPLIRRALAINEQNYGKDHHNVVATIGNLANLLKDTNRYSEAEPLIRRALAIDEQRFGKNHPNVSADLNSLGLLLKTTNRFAEAESLIRRALIIDELSSGKDHHNVAATLNNLANLLRDTNRFSEAEPLIRRALVINEHTFGKDHPKVATNLSNLARLLKNTNRFSEAEPLLRRALTINEKSFGKDSPNIATDLNNLSTLFFETDRFFEAEPLIQKGLVINEKTFGKDHPAVTTNLINLALLFRVTNRLAKAEQLMRRALIILLQFTRDNRHPHPYLQSVVSYYVDLLRANGITEKDILANLQELAPDFSWGKDENAQCKRDETNFLQTSGSSDHEEHANIDRQPFKYDKEGSPLKEIIFREIQPSASMQEIYAAIATAIHPATLPFDQALVQVADLPFYEEFKLYAVTDLRLPTGNIYELLCGPGGAFLLDGSNEPIYEVNKMAPIKFDRATLAPYIRFFLHYTCSSMGHFIVAETMEDIPWLPEANEEEMAEAASKLEPITYKGADEDGFFTLSGTIVFHDGLYRTDILVAAREMEMKDADSEEIEPLVVGEIRLINEEVLLQNLKVHSEGLPEDDDQEIGLHAATAFQLYEAFPQTDGINFLEQTAEIAAEVVASFPPEIQPTATSEDGFLLQTAELPFYTNFSLCALTDQAASSPNVRFFLLRQGPTGMIVPMNKTNEPVYTINENAPITLTAETLPPYAKFFFFLVQGQLGRFIIADKPEDVDWLPKATAKEKADVAAHLMPVTYNGIDTDGLHSLKATVIFRDALFRTDIKVAPKAMDVFDPELNAPEHFTIGQMKLANEELLLESLSVPIALSPENDLVE